MNECKRSNNNPRCDNRVLKKTIGSILLEWNSRTFPNNIVEKYFETWSICPSSKTLTTICTLIKHSWWYFSQWSRRQHSLHRLVSQAMAEGVKSFALSPPCKIYHGTRISPWKLRSVAFSSLARERERKEKKNSRACGDVLWFFYGWKWTMFRWIKNFEKMNVYIFSLLDRSWVLILSQERIFEILYRHSWYEI